MLDTVDIDAERACERLALAVYSLMDQGRYEETAALFTDDAVWVRGDKPVAGRDAILAALHQRSASEASRHLVTNVVVDIRSELQRERDGLIPGAIFHPRNVLEWRMDPASGYDDPRISRDLDRRIILVCDEGYQSSLAAATLQDLGFAHATDLDGGFQAWRAAGLPVEPLAPAVYPA